MLSDDIEKLIIEKRRELEKEKATLWLSQDNDLVNTKVSKSYESLKK